MPCGRLAAVGALTLAVIAAMRSALACSCAEPTPDVAYERASAVFVGTVTDIERPLLDRFGITRSGLWNVSFAVIKRWKGRPAAAAVVRTRVSGESCGYAFEEGLTYLVYVIDDAEPRTGICTGTKQVEHAAHDIRKLDALAPGSFD